MTRLSDYFNKVLYSKKISFLGVKKAGKSQILQTLGCPGIAVDGDSQTEMYHSFRIDFSPIGIDRKVFVRSGVDLGGELELFKARYKKSIRRGDYILFVVDARRFFDDDIDPYDSLNYRMAVLQRLDVINRNLPIKDIDKFYVVLTHADQFENRTEIQTSFQQIVNSDSLKTVSKWIRQYYVIDARDKADVLNIFNRLIKA